jgi:hypothetical protein
MVKGRGQCDFKQKIVQPINTCKYLFDQIHLNCEVGHERSRSL